MENNEYNEYENHSITEYCVKITIYWILSNKQQREKEREVSENVQRGFPSIHLLNKSEHWSGLYSAVCPPPCKPHTKKTLCMSFCCSCRNFGQDKKERVYLDGCKCHLICVSSCISTNTDENSASLKIMKLVRLEFETMVFLFTQQLDCYSSSKVSSHEQWNSWELWSKLELKRKVP